MQTFTATVRGRKHLSPHLVTITLGLDAFPTTGIPDEYVRILIPTEGQDLVLPTIGENYSWTYPEGTVEPEPRVYTISDHRMVDGTVEVDLDIALHDEGVGSDWARRCRLGDQVGIVEPHGLYKAAADVPWQLLVCDITGLPALARILRGLQPDQRAEVVVVLTDAADQIALPSQADVTVEWVVVDRVVDVSDALTAAVVERELPAAGPRYVWLAGEARASRAARRRLRRELRWPQSDFYTCGYWQVDAERWNARYEEVAEQLTAEAIAVQQRVGDDEGAYLDALDEMYERVGL